jgi:hypothetical protein
MMLKPKAFNYFKLMYDQLWLLHAYLMFSLVLLSIKSSARQPRYA